MQAVLFVVMTLLVIGLLILIFWRVFILPRKMQEQIGSRLDVLLELSRTHSNDLRSYGKEIREEITNQLSKISDMQVGYLKTVSNQLSAVLKEVEVKLEKIRRENTEQLEKIRGVVDEKLNETLHKRLSQHFTTLQDLLDKVSKSVGEVKSLSSEMVDLKRVLSGIRTRGMWGEIQLERLLSEFLREGVQYEKNVLINPSLGERVEFVIKLPSKESDSEYILLPVDAKFPLDVFQKLIDAYQVADKKAISANLQLLARTLKEQAAKISKYIVPPKTTNFAVMYLPLESLYAEAVKIPGLIEEIQRRFNVVITGPNTFTAFVISLNLGFRTLKIQQSTQQVWRLITMIRNDFAKFGKLLQSAIADLEKTRKRLEDAMYRTEQINRKVERIEGLKGKVVHEELEPSKIISPS